jgi:hypothetical protein
MESDPAFDRRVEANAILDTVDAMNVFLRKGLEE